MNKQKYEMKLVGHRIILRMWTLLNLLSK